MEIDWQRLQGELQTGRTISALVGQRALECILGSETLEHAVDVAAQCQPGYSVAESVLSVIRSRRATEYCYQRIRGEEDDDVRCLYVSVLRSCASDVALSWLASLWRDRNPNIQVLAAKMLTGLIVARLGDLELLKESIVQGLRHPNVDVREEVRDAAAWLESTFDVVIDLGDEEFDA